MVEKVQSQPRRLQHHQQIFNNDDHQQKVIVVSMYMPWTVSFEDDCDHVPPAIRSPVKQLRRMTSSMETTGPPSRYLFRSDSDATRLPFVPHGADSHHDPRQAHYPLGLSGAFSEESSSSSYAQTVKDFTLIQSAQGNQGLHKAVQSSQLNRLHVGLLADLGHHDLLSRNDKSSITDLMLEKQCVPVFVSENELNGHYTKFCKEVLWPTMHYIQPTSSTKEDDGWQHYVTVNQRIADAVVDQYQEGDIIWVHDYHLMLVPMFVRLKLRDAVIGFFLHVPFPCSEVFRCLQVRRQLLEGVLGADLIGFQTRLYQRYFLQTATRILQCESTQKGVLLENTMVSCSVFPIGIDTALLDQNRKTPEVAQMIEVLQERYHGKKVIVGRDKLDLIKGVKQKLKAFDMFLQNYPEWQGKVVLVQVALSTTEQPDLQRQISDLVSRINSKYGTIEYTPVVYLYQDISFSHYLALLTIADACLISSLRDGMNLTSHEYVVCQEHNKSPLILSEFTGTYGTFKEAIRINPWDVREIANAINSALVMSGDEKQERHDALYSHVTHNTGAHWAESYVAELTKLSSDIQRRYSIDIPHMSMSTIQQPWQQYEKRLLMLNYDGILVPYERNPDVSSAADQKAVAVLQQLCNDPCNVVYILSGRTKQSLDDRLGNVQNLGLSAENGAFVKHPNSGEWFEVKMKGQDSLHLDAEQWKEKVTETLEYYTERTPGSYIETKETALVWHYRLADSIFGQWQAKEMQNHISDSIESHYPIHAVNDRKHIEIRPSSVSKVNVAMDIARSIGATSVQQQQNTSSSIVAIYIGDDRSDEDVFEWMNTNRTQQLQPNQQPADIHYMTCCVGYKSSHAEYFLTGPVEVVRLFERLSATTTTMSKQ